MMMPPMMMSTRYAGFTSMAMPIIERERHV